MRCVSYMDCIEKPTLSGSTNNVPCYHTVTFLKVNLALIFQFLSNTASSDAPQIRRCRGDAGIEPRAVVMIALAVQTLEHLS
jgi:hypothetical protein